MNQTGFARGIGGGISFKLGGQEWRPWGKAVVGLGAKPPQKLTTLFL